MARFSSILFNGFIFLLLAGPAGLAQGTGSAPQNKTGSTAAKDKAATPAASKPDTNTEKAAPLAPEMVHRIQTEIRTHYNVPPQIGVSLSDPKPGKTPGYDDLAITLTGGGKSSTHDFLISKDRKTLAHLETYDVSQDIMSKIDLKGRPLRGNPEATVTIVNFDDFQCPFCSHMHSTLFTNIFKDYSSSARRMAARTTAAHRVSVVHLKISSCAILIRSTGKLVR